jgi:hypothetical protein
VEKVRGLPPQIKSLDAASSAHHQYRCWQTYNEEGGATATCATMYLRCIKAMLVACLIAHRATWASASDEIIAADWVAQCAATDEIYGRCAATVSEVVNLVDNYQYQYPHFIVCWKQLPLPPVGDLPTAAQMSWFRELVSATVQYLRDNPSAAKMPAAAVMLAAFMRRWPCGGVGVTGPK